MKRTACIVALDVPTMADVRPVLARLPEAIQWYKVGLELFTAAGPQVFDLLHEHEKRIFLDLKLHDIPNTVAAAVRSACAHGVDLLTVHACGGRAMLEAAAGAAAALGDQAPKLIAVTTLTSLGQTDLSDIGVSRTLNEQAVALGSLALESGIDGLVCSVHEVGELRRSFGPDPILVTPGIRLGADTTGDQKRVATPEAAAQQGSSYIVVGRSLLNAPEPHDTARTILQALEPR